MWHWGALYRQIDEVRQWQARMLDTVGLGLIETPHRIVFTRPGVRLRAYGSGGESGPVLLLVPAPIKHPHLWDLAPEVSVVRQCLRSGMRVYLAEWMPPTADQQGHGLAEYADRFLLDCLEALEAETGERSVFLAGYSLGGTLAAIFAALHPGRVRGLVLLGAPLRFGPGVGALGRLMRDAPHAEQITARLGNVPGSFLSAVGVSAAPVSFMVERWWDWLQSAADPQAMRTHLRVERWAMGEAPMARRLYEEVVELLYREDRFMRGTLRIGGRQATPERVQAPMLNVVEARSEVVPPTAVLPFHEAAGSTDRQLLWYEGDTGMAFQHVGMLVGRTAHQQIWPEILRWIRSHA